MPTSDYESQLHLIHNLSEQAQWVQGYQPKTMGGDLQSRVVKLLLMPLKPQSLEANL